MDSQCNQKRVVGQALNSYLKDDLDRKRSFWSYEWAN